ELRQRFVIEAPPTQDAGDAIGQLGGGARQPRLEAREKAGSLVAHRSSPTRCRSATPVIRIAMSRPGSLGAVRRTGAKCSVCPTPPRSLSTEATLSIRAASDRASAAVACALSSAARSRI